MPDGEKIKRIFVHPEAGKPFVSRGDAERLIEELRAQSTRGFGTKVVDLAKYLFPLMVRGRSLRREGAMAVRLPLVRSLSTS